MNKQILLNGSVLVLNEKIQVGILEMVKKIEFLKIEFPIFF